MGRPTVSVIMTAFNAERFLAQALDSVRHQTFKDFECIVVDDGSTDLTYNIARAFAERDPRIWVTDAPHRGAESGYNLALAHATGKYVAYLASDDYWLPDFLETSVAILEKDESVSGAYSDFIAWDEERGLKHIIRLPAFDRERLLQENYVNLSALVQRVSIFANERWAPVSDWAIIIEMTKLRPLAHLREVLMVRRVHRGQMSFYARRKTIFVSFMLPFHFAPFGSAIKATRRRLLGLAWNYRQP